MNLAERLKWRLGKYPTRLRCPFDNEWMCLVDDEHSPDCAHYNPETDECFHVEAARAQAQAAKALKELAETVCMAYDRMPELMSRFFGGDSDA